MNKSKSIETLVPARRGLVHNAGAVTVEMPLEEPSFASSMGTLTIHAGTQES